MATKINRQYGGGSPTVNVNYGSDFGPDEIMGYIQQFQNMKSQNQANQRAERMAILQEAQMKYNQQIAEQTKNQELALNQFSTQGLDFEAATNPDMNVAFSAKLPNLSEQWKGYSERSKANGIGSPDFSTFQNNVTKQNAAYMNTIIGRFNVLADQYRRDNPNATQSSLMKHMRDNHNAEQVYKNYAQVSAMGGGELMQKLDYVPPTVDEPWYKDLASIVYSPGIEGGPGKFKAGAPAAIVGTGSALYGAAKLKSALGEGSETFIKQLQEDIKPYDKKTKKGLTPAKFTEKYGQNKKSFGSKADKLNFEATKKAYMDAAKNLGKDSKVLKWGKAAGKGLAPYIAADTLAGMVTEEGTVGGELGEMASVVGAPALGKMTSNIYNKVKKMGTKKALEKIAKKGGWKLAAKVAGKGALGAIGTPFSGGTSAVLSGALLTKDLYDIYTILNEE